MIGFNLLVVVCLAYVVLLFSVAFAAERRAERGDVGWLRSPLVYTLSLSIYCTAWTFYGAVGYAVNSGLEFATIYLGPTLVMAGWWWILRKLVRIGRSQRITSVADLISSRYGKSNLLGVCVTLLAVVGTTPYIALQLQSVTLSFSVFAGHEGAVPDFEQLNATAVVVAIGLTVFTILFGTRTLDANERHHGVVTAIALEAVVKLVALLAVGIFVVWGLADGPVDIARKIEASKLAEWNPAPGRWAGLIFLSAAAFLCLPRMFQVMVVENSNERHVAVASWAFPLYLFLMSLFVVPIAVVGLEVLPNGNADLYVLTVPLAERREGLAMLSFLGGFSSATSMVIVAAIALSTMVSNHIVMPIWLNMRRERASMSGDVRDVVITARRISIAGVLLLGYLYFHLSGGSTALAAIGLISFAGVAQVLPALLGGLFWRGASRNGAAAGLGIGFAVWAYTLFLPSFGETILMSGPLLAEGPFGISWLRPQALFGVSGLDPVVHSVFWSMVLNTAAFVVFSLASFPGPLERLQGAQFVNVFEHSTAAPGWSSGGAEAEDLLIMAQRILGPDEAQALFQKEAARQGGAGYLPDTTPDFIETLERQLAGSVGAATAHAMVGQITGGASVSVQDLMAVADETAQIMEHTTQLEAQREELSRTARQLREANEKLTQLSIQKDAFLSQISHELRTPMTSIRAFSEILMTESPMPEADQRRFSTIIHDETIRLTRLLDDLLDLSVLENGQGSLNWQNADLGHVIERAVAATTGREAGAPMTILRDPTVEKVRLVTDPDRLAQVFINLIANAQKYCDAEAPELRISVSGRDDAVRVDFTDNGTGIPKQSQAVIFEKFSRLSDQSRAGGAGLGLAICREIMERLGGSVSYLPGQGGAAFRVVLPRAQAKAAE
ncbi:sensor histidine kinase [Pseudoruegeria sp. HB172150]|uniref:ATP-binding protein n=1 Tax=Pseudoruegeria sp. HB172150 TaxID=2721164 RepID=UPI0015519E3D|nr:sensor histidine kinase [Pseudoruegeria sp. HB172150]